MRVLLLTILLLATAHLGFFNHGVVEAYNPHNLYPAVPVTAGDGLDKQPPVTEQPNDWWI